MRFLRPLFLAGLAGVLLALVAVSGAASPAEPGPPPERAAAPADGVPEVYPTPRSLEKRPDGFRFTPVAGIVPGPATDPPALREVEEILRRAGGRRIERAPATSPRRGRR